MFGIKLPKWPTKTEWRHVNDDVYEAEFTIEVKLTVKEIIARFIQKRGRRIATWLHLHGDTGMCGMPGPQGPKGDRGQKGELDADSLIALLHNDPNVKQAVLALTSQNNS